ncbi:MAG: choice-of-anchor R domain-containing protein, partial [Kiritimatiellia bacterium]|nr:choice-of-anchor R domain-containing protein [Kiritimatiellia bacterium]
MLKQIHKPLSLLTLGLILGSLLAAALPAEAATVAASGTAPTVDDADIAQLVTNYTPGGNEGHVWANRPIHGQSFTTGDNAGGYLLKAVTLRNENSSGSPGGWDIYVGTISGSVLTPVGTESSGSVTISANNYITWTFDTPIELDPNTLYG